MVAHPYRDPLSWGAQGPPDSTHRGLRSTDTPKDRHRVPRDCAPGPLCRRAACPSMQAGSTLTHSSDTQPGHGAARGGWKGHLSFVPFLLLPAVSSCRPELRPCTRLPSHLCKQRIQRETLGRCSSQPGPGLSAPQGNLERLEGVSVVSECGLILLGASRS